MDSPYLTTPYAGHYPNHYPSVNAAIPQALPYYPPYAAQLPVPQPPKQAPVDSSPDPPEPAVTPQVASKALKRLVTYELKKAGFRKAEQPALERLELEVAAFVQQLFQRAHEYANLANRAGAIASDVLLACEDFDLSPKELHQAKRLTKKQKRLSQGPDGAPPKPVALEPPPSRSPSPELLSSDDEEAPATIPTTLRNLPSYFPNLPPKHTYLQTPASPPKKAALPSLEKKLKTAALVQESLQNLLLATEDSMNQEDGELLGHIVNWEMNVQPRKRWKVGTK
ncbi:hypothetical protein CVT26_001678 [Gymnopilus dilepis]|uniref:Transcription initiation factor TFIID subunit 8 n=1 Tax=Gymnopilus dilepis TaxID=231916 RepID=A0A409VRG0_9AGAR|nr:hypothetical protein CVT26_001678 [Gymnopilus dilepis]